VKRWDNVCGKFCTLLMSHLDSFVVEIFTMHVFLPFFSDMLHSKYRSSTKAKKLSRKVKQSMLDDEVDQIMNRSSYRDITHRVKELTKDARKDSDFQNAFNRANLELLTTFKTEQIREEVDGDDDEDDDDGDNGDDHSPQKVSSAL
jgi:hypothetical protein